MRSKKNYFPSMLLAALIALLPLCLHGENPKSNKSMSTKESAVQEQTYASMPDPGKKVPMGGGHYLIYGFDKKPKLGTVIMKVEIFNGEGKKETSMEVKADAGMPSMRGAHETGEQAFKLSKKGDYLLPISIVMPGGWEIRVTIAKDGKVIFRGRYNFDV